MNEIFLGFVIISIAFAGLAVGLIIKNKPIKGSCGGLANIDESGSCTICGRSDPTNCSTQN